MKKRKWAQYLQYTQLTNNCILVLATLAVLVPIYREIGLIVFFIHLVQMILGTIFSYYQENLNVFSLYILECVFAIKIACTLLCITAIIIHGA